MTVNRLKEKHKFGRNNSNCFHYELQRRPLMNLDLVQLIFSVDFIEFQCLVVRVIARRDMFGRHHYTIVTIHGYRYTAAAAAGVDFQQSVEWKLDAV